MKRRDSFVDRWPKRLRVWVLVLVGLVIYGGVLTHGFMIGDDEDQILNNPLVHDWRNIPMFFGGSTYFRAESGQQYGWFYRPLMLTAYALIYQLAGANPLWFHGVQLGLHLVGVVLVMEVFERLGMGKGGAFLGGLLFLVHPLNTETVADVANLQEVLMQVLGLGFVLLVMGMKKQTQTLGWVKLGGLGLVSLWAKETAMVWLVMGGVWGWREKRARMGLVATLVVVMGVYGWMRIYGAGVTYGAPALSQLAGLSTLERWMHVPAVLWYYWKTFWWPARLVVYQYWVLRGVSMASMGWPLLGLGGVVGAGIWGWKRMGQSRDKRWAYGWLAGVVFLGLGVHAQLVPLYVTVAERWGYVPIVGMIGLVMLALSSLKLNIKAVEAGVILILVGLSWRTMVRVGDWADAKTLLVHDAGLAENDYYLRNLLASVYLREKNYEAAATLVEESTEMFPFVGNVTNRALVRAYLGDDHGARSDFEWAMNLGQVYATRVNYVNYLLYRQKDYEAVGVVATRELESYPYGGDLWLALAQAKYELGDGEEALAAALKADRFMGIPLSGAVLKQIRHGEELKIEEFIAE